MPLSANDSMRRNGRRMAQQKRRMPRLMTAGQWRRRFGVRRPLRPRPV